MVNKLNKDVVCSWSFEELIILYAEQNINPNEKPEFDCSDDGSVIFFKYKKRKYEIKCFDILNWLYKKVRHDEKIFVGRFIS